MAAAGIVAVVGTSPSLGADTWLRDLGLGAGGTLGPTPPVDTLAGGAPVTSAPVTSAPATSAPATSAPASPPPATTGSAPPVTPLAAEPGYDAASIPRRASGRLVMVPGRSAANAPGRRLVYRLQVEAGLPFDPATVAGTVHSVLSDRRGWQPLENLAFERTDGAGYELTIVIASPATTDRLCYPLDTAGRLSCRNGQRVIFNAIRWAVGVPWYGGRMDLYHAYLVNHEVGHTLGHAHEYCPGPGRPAPVMMQQSKGVGQCRPNPWPAVNP